jgi:hypothetical protein
MYTSLSNPFIYLTMHAWVFLWQTACISSTCPCIYEFFSGKVHANLMFARILCKISTPSTIHVICMSTHAGVYFYRSALNKFNLFAYTVRFNFYSNARGINVLRICAWPLRAMMVLRKLGYGLDQQEKLELREINTRYYYTREIIVPTYG